MYEHGDKFGGNKHSYNSSLSVSIVHYSSHVKKEDAEDLTPEVCFKFCRTIPDMLFFGLHAGRECYCEPYYERMASDSSNCDAGCTGDPTQMCGGMKKSSIYQMHSCKK